LGKNGEALISPPGGCVIGRRHLEPHFEALTGLGAEIHVNPEYYHAHLLRAAGGDIFLPEASVTATENALLLAATSPQQTIINNAACEPHVCDLARVLSKMGAEIEGIGTHCLQINGKKELTGFTHRVEADYIEAGTFAIMAATTGGQVLIREAKYTQMRITEYYLRKIGVQLKFDTKNDTLLVNSGKLTSQNLKIQAGLYPNFPTDLMSPMICLATRAAGTTLCHDWMFESRMFFVDKLIAMGANIILCDPHRVLVSGPTALKGQSLTSPDIRAGIALVIAALSARGSSVIENAELIDRGYENIVKRLQQIGASIRRQDESATPPMAASPYSVSTR
jgi:UDP-N-acetylglucosamine 1-carboxyvinyltransferase